MKSEQYEIEIKSLLGSKDSAEALLEKMHTLDPETKCIGESSQLNHYFIVGDTGKIFVNIVPSIAEEKIASFKKILYEGKNISVRTRKSNDTVLFVIKASIDDTTSSNGTARLEFETETPDLSLDELDNLLLDAGSTYQAKWSRDRKEYAFQGITVCIDKNAGYGYLAEFEKLVTDGAEAEAVKTDLREMMQTLGASELDQERLARMFAHYNEHWSEYYGTDKTFTIL
ncbi:MAG: hypothetical protein AUK58_03165 [Candidatus Moranbacteria bacterium CG2_30_41_165]|nr:MAG: hypothetical protein AUK58_03165 [Candidatus Moranbacteria bacterium CG2_30_41_165]PJB99863.1 MAG: hypothetical protein CO075_03625 [Candidatus Moranbacteria bacterium CG_4_9_14_0_8_um_filter_41_43]HCJ45511.1 hypothetical protein [Candidatus Moranbacteria bacterium]